MNKKIVISADSVCDLSESMIKKYSVHILPFYVMIKDARFQDYTEVDLSSIYEYIKNDDTVISSIPASVEEYREHFSKLTENGTKTIIHITLSKKLSAAHSNAVEAAKDFEDVHVIDSGLISHGMGIFVLTAADLARRNATLEIILDELKTLRKKISCTFVFKTTQYVANNNRLNQTLSNLMRFFRLKPIIALRHNELKVIGICLGGKNSYMRKYVRKVLRKRKNVSDAILFISMTNCSEEFQNAIYNEVTRKVDWKRVYIQNVSASNYCNLGPDSVGLMFCTKR